MALSESSQKTKAGEENRAPQIRNLVQCDGKRVAVVFSAQEETRTLVGSASWRQDENLGWVLRITLESETTGAEPTALIISPEWVGEVLPDANHNCDYCIWL